MSAFALMAIKGKRVRRNRSKFRASKCDASFLMQGGARVPRRTDKALSFSSSSLNSLSRFLLSLRFCPLLPSLRPLFPPALLLSFRAHLPRSSLSLSCLIQ